MYQKQFVDGSSVWFPHPVCTWQISGFADCYYLLARGRYGRLSLGRLSREFYDLQSLHLIRDLRQNLYSYGDAVWAWRSYSFDPVVEMLRALADLNVRGLIQPLPDFELVHPAAHAAAITLGHFSYCKGCSQSECWAAYDPLAVNLQVPLVSVK